MSRPIYPPRRSGLVVADGYLHRPVIGLDIDGTLGVYHDHFLRFAEGWFGKKMPGLRMLETVYDGSVPLHRWMGVSKARYRQCKLAYRKGGLKRSMPVQPGAALLARSVRERGAVVVVCTTRPFLMLENVDPDTHEWLRRNGIQYDFIIHGENKYRDLARSFEPGRVIMVLEDLPELYAQASKTGVRPVLISRPHNHHNRMDYGVELVAPDLTFAGALALNRIDRYEQEHS